MPLKLLLLLTLATTARLRPEPPHLYLIGDSTVKTGSGNGQNGQWGWGSVLAQHFDTTRLKIHNHAIGGRSSRTFVSEGRWETVLSALQPGNYLLIQFGHNDSSPVNDTLRARGTIKGIGEETEEIDNLITKKHEIVHSYGWYLRKFIDEAKARGAIPIVCSPIPRNQWEQGRASPRRIVRPDNSYPQWARTVARAKGAFFIDLYELVAAQYDRSTPAQVKEIYFTALDDTHTSLGGAELNAQMVVKGMRSLKKCGLRRYLR